MVDMYSFFHEFNQIVLEQIGRNKIVLILDNMLNHNSNCSDLVVLHRNVNCIVIRIISLFFPVFDKFMCGFVLVDDRVFE
jgi:hypothetical protein